VRAKLKAFTREQISFFIDVNATIRKEVGESSACPKFYL